MYYINDVCEKILWALKAGRTHDVGETSLHVKQHEVLLNLLLSDKLNHICDWRNFVSKETVCCHKITWNAVQKKLFCDICFVSGSILLFEVFSFLHGYLFNHRGSDVMSTSTVSTGNVCLCQNKRARTSSLCPSAQQYPTTASAPLTGDKNLEFHGWNSKKVWEKASCFFF